MRTSGLIFMLVSWGFIICLMIFCVARTVMDKKRSDKNQEEDEEPSLF